VSAGQGAAVRQHSPQGNSDNRPEALARCSPPGSQRGHRHVLRAPSLLRATRHANGVATAGASEGRLGPPANPRRRHISPARMSECERADGLVGGLRAAAYTASPSHTARESVRRLARATSAHHNARCTRQRHGLTHGGELRGLVWLCALGGRSPGRRLRGRTLERHLSLDSKRKGPGRVHVMHLRRELSRREPVHPTEPSRTLDVRFSSSLRLDFPRGSDVCITTAFPFYQWLATGA